jgi:adhesin transport system outer membrane protein
LAHGFRFGLVVVALAMVVPQAAARAQSLTDELQVLADTHPEIASRRHAADAAGSDIDRASSGYLPKLDISAGMGPQYIDSPLTRRAGGGEWLSVAQLAGVHLSQNLFNGFATPAQVQAATLHHEGAVFSLGAARQQILFEGISAYLEVLRQRRLVELGRGSEETIKRQLRLEDERVQRGAGIAVDVLQAKSRLQLAKEQRIAFEGALRAAIGRYLQIFARPPQVEAMALPALPLHLLPGDLDAAIAAARADSPALNASLAAVAEAGEGRRLARAGHYPSLDLIAGANYEKDTDLVEGTRTDVSVLLRATWTLFDGFATSAAAASAAARYRGSRADHDALERRVIEAVRLAWHGLETAKERRDLSRNGVAIAGQVFEMRRKLRAAGRETAINVLDAEDELTTALIAQTMAEADVALAAYRMLAAIGRLDRQHLGLRVER